MAVTALIGEQVCIHNGLSVDQIPLKGASCDLLWKNSLKCGYLSKQLLASL